MEMLHEGRVRAGRSRAARDFATLLHGVRFPTNESFTYGIFHVIFSEHGGPWVTETVEDKTVVSSFLKSLS